MIFWTILFLTIGLYGVFKGPLFSETGKKLKMLNIRHAEGESADKLLDEYVKAGCLPIITALILTVIEFIYLVNAISFDIYKIPTLVAIMYFIISFIASFMKKNVSKMDEYELAKEKVKALQTKNVTYKTVIKNLIWSTYFGYMLYILIF